MRRQEEVLRRTYGDVLGDFWGIYEWQGRGSVHLHCLMWLRDAPQRPVDELLKATLKLAQGIRAPDAEAGDALHAEALRQALAADEHLGPALAEWCAYFDRYITAVNPAVIPAGRPGGAGQQAPTFEDPYYCRPALEKLPPLEHGHVCSYLHGELEEERDATYLMNFCQRHTQCRPGACLRRDRRTGLEKCRLGAPWAPASASHFAFQQGRLAFVPRRNDPLLGNVPSMHFRRWRANTDIKPVISRHALTRYLTKYLTKSELSTEDMLGAVHQVIKRNPAASAASVYMRCLNMTHKRDYSAQEVTHHVLQLPGHHCTRVFQVATSTDEMDPNTGQRAPSAYAKYLRRAELVPEAHREHAATLCFYDWVRFYQVSGRFSRRQKEAVPRIYPAVYCTHKRDPAKFKDWVAFQIRCLVPHASEEDLAAVEDPEAYLSSLVLAHNDPSDLKLNKLSHEWEVIQNAPGEGQEGEETSASDSDDGDAAPAFNGPVPDVGAAGMPRGEGARASGLLYADAAGWVEAHTRYGPQQVEQMAEFVKCQKALLGDQSYDLDLSGFNADLLNE